MQQLSSQNRNIFQKIYDEIKYLVKTVTSGSKEGKQLEKVKKLFDEVYRETGKTETKDYVQYSINYTQDNRAVAVIENDIFDGKFAQLDKSERIKLAKKEIKKFRPGVPVSGRLVGVTKKTADHYTNSDYTDIIRKNQEEVYEDKLNAAQNLDDVIYASTDYVNEELNHTRKDDITQFARGNVLLDIGGKQYNAKVIVGYKENGEMVFYDLQDLVQDSFEYKKRYNQNQSVKTEPGKTTASPITSIPQNQENGTRNQEKYSISEKNDDIAPTGNWNIRGEDIALEAIAPVRKDIAPAKGSAAVGDIAPWNPDEPEENLDIGPFSQSN
ncbi:MAG: hypothetical protein IJZ53_05810 [Tyzzerella sp.]|nr:hypothetical protein [Tyzzerella sp.]